MVFERYGLSLFDFLKKNHYHPFRVEHVAEIGYQLVKAVACMFTQIFLSAIKNLSLI